MIENEDNETIHGPLTLILIWALDDFDDIILKGYEGIEQMIVDRHYEEIISLIKTMPNKMRSGVIIVQHNRLWATGDIINYMSLKS